MVIDSRITSFAPQLLVDDLERAIRFYREVLGFSFGPTWQGFYAIGERDALRFTLSARPKRSRIALTGGKTNIWMFMPASLEWARYMMRARRRARPF